MHGTDAVDPLRHGNRDVVRRLVADPEQAHALGFIRRDAVGQPQRFGKLPHERVAEHLIFAVAHKDIRNQVLALLELGLVEDQAEQLGVVLVENVSTATLGDRPSNRYPPQFEFGNEVVDQNPAGQQSDDGADHQDDRNDGKEYLVLEADISEALGGFPDDIAFHGRLNERHSAGP